MLPSADSAVGFEGFEPLGFKVGECGIGYFSSYGYLSLQYIAWGIWPCSGLVWFRVAGAFNIEVARMMAYLHSLYRSTS